MKALELTDTKDSLYVVENGTTRVISTLASKIDIDPVRGRMLVLQLGSNSGIPGAPASKVEIRVAEDLVHRLALRSGLIDDLRPEYHDEDRFAGGSSR